MDLGLSRKGQIFSVLARQLAVPTVLACAWGLYDWHSGGGSFVLANYVRTVLPALFLIMWFVGLYERARKRESDDANFTTLQSNVRSLGDLLRTVLQARPTLVGQVPALAETPPTFSASLIEEAEKLLQAGYTLAALLQAGVAFEHALRAFGAARGLEGANQMQLLSLLQKAELGIPKEWIGELHALRQMRNALVHASQSELERIAEPASLLGTYADAIRMLEFAARTREGARHDDLVVGENARL